MRNYTLLALPCLFFCASMAAPALASPTGSVDRQVFVVIPATSPMTPPMLDLTIYTTVTNADPTTSYANIHRTMIYCGDVIAEQPDDVSFAVARETIFHLKVHYGEVCGAKPENTPTSKITLKGSKTAQEGAPYNPPVVLAVDSKTWGG